MRQSKQGRLGILSTAALLALLLTALSGCPKDEEAEDEGLAVRTVSIFAVQRGDMVETVSLVGELQGVEEVRVLAMVTDRIRRLAVREGDVVRAGEVLAILASDITSSVVEQAEAGLEAAVANRDALEREVRRIRPLIDAGSAPRSQLDTLETQLRAATAQVRQATAGAGQASVQQGRTVVRSPIAGVVTGINMREGEIAAPSVPLLTIVRTDQLKAVVRAPERHFLRIREGMEVTVTPIGGERTEVRASVSLKGPVVERMTRTGLVEIALDNSEGLLVPGSMVKVMVEIDRRSDVVLAPGHAVLFTGDTERTGRAYVFMAEDGVAQRREIVVGDRQDGNLEIREGLREGEKIIVRGAQFIRDGSPIRSNVDASIEAGDRSGRSSGEGAAGDSETESTSRIEAEESSEAAMASALESGR